MVGYSNIDGLGQAGIERSFNNFLKESSEPLALTIDVRLQHVLRREVLKSMKDFTAKSRSRNFNECSNWRSSRGDIFARF